MGCELTVPQVFEPGARVAWRGSDLGPRILSHIAGSHWYGVTEDGTEVRLCYADLASIHLDVVAPAPREGQRWTSGPLMLNVQYAICDVEFARDLLKYGYSYAGPADAAPATLRASEAAAVEPTPAPWTREDSRRCVAAYMRSVENEPFGRAIAHVLGAVAEMDPLVNDAQARGIIAGLRAWEARRSEVAPGMRQLRPAQRAACAAAANEACLAACGWLPEQAPVSEERIGDIYERARS